MSERDSTRPERGQASPEWVGLILLVGLLVTGALAGLGPLPLGISLARTVGGKLICAVALSDACRRDPELVAAYGAGLSEAVRDHAPAILYERGMRALPVDFRRCRSPSCSDAAPRGRVWRSAGGEPATAFVRVIDCRPGASSPLGASRRTAICSGPQTGNLYLQYWLYYPDSATLRGAPVAGAKGYHRDDWESYQVRIGPDGDSDARASSHHGYNYAKGAGNWGSDAGIGPLREAAEATGARDRNGWGPEIGFVFISGGSHAGNVAAFPLDYPRFTPPRRLALIPLEALTATERATAFAVSPPWAKQAWRDPEAQGTD